MTKTDQAIVGTGVTLARNRLILLSLTLCSGCEAFIGEYAADLNPNPFVSTNKLCNVEREKFIVDIDFNSDAQLSELADYYERQNPELISHFEHLAEVYRMGGEVRGATYVMGDAGVGKSFAMRHLLEPFTADNTCEIEVADWLTLSGEEWGLGFEQVPELITIDQKEVLNTLPGFTDPDAFDFAELLRAWGCVDAERSPALIVLDGVDELDNASARSVLERVDEYLLSRATGFLHVVIAGRPEGFAPWLTHPTRNERNNELVEQFQLQAPVYATAGDVEFRLRGYLDFTNQLAGIEEQGLFETYQRSLNDALKQYGFLTYSLGNLALGNVVIEHTSPGRDESQADLKSGLFDDLLKRNSETHRRPGDGSPLEEAYRRLFEEVAAGHVDVDELGQFVVSSTETVSVPASGDSVVLNVRVRDLLQHSGVAYLTSASTPTPRYRFSPFWLHGYLVDRYNSRHGYPESDCE